MHDEIGEAAGAVWRVLAEGGPISKAKVKKATGLEAEMLAMALGWLAREGQIEWIRQGQQSAIALKAANACE